MEQLGELAEGLVEERIRKGTASPTETVALLRAYSPTEIANLQRIKAQTALLEAQREKAIAETLQQDMIDKAVAAMGRYTR